jgi:hypothetical protein
MNRTLMLALAALAAAAGAGVSAHHSQVAVYETTTTQTIEGKIVLVQIRSPHSWVHVEVDEKDPTGKPLRYGIEWGSAAQLTRSGIDGKTLKVGDLVRVTGRPGRDKTDHRMLVMTMVRPSDGWKWPTREGEVVD